MQHNQKGYTLIELLIVINIIGILAAIEIPNMQETYDRGKGLKDEAIVIISSLAVNVGDYIVSSSGQNSTPVPMLTPSILPTSNMTVPQLLGVMNGMQTQMQGAVNNQFGGTGTASSGIRIDPAQDHAPQNVPLTIILER